MGVLKGLRSPRHSETFFRRKVLPIVERVSSTLLSCRAYHFFETMVDAHLYETKGVSPYNGWLLRFIGLGLGYTSFKELSTMLSKKR